MHVPEQLLEARLRSQWVKMRVKRNPKQTKSTQDCFLVHSLLLINPRQPHAKAQIVRVFLPAFQSKSEGIIEAGFIRPNTASSAAASVVLCANEIIIS